ncbi:MAG TPA: thioredoxin-like domain-containing protein [Gemmataceae bacterium]|jgi:sugar lactone lactonase YvrE/cytochrome oxidase Cu insertion factor (SCO1/SenC/PrrC family)|nr:thioredoxin-like domain-containing protein [Gemmataceae bacterium]
MQTAPSGNDRFFSPRIWLLLLSFLIFALTAVLGYNRLPPRNPAALNLPLGGALFAQEPGQRIKAPELDGGVAWINSAGPIQIQRDLKGKIVVLDFWTFCCINCIHTLPDLAKIEKKYEKEVVVVGVHTAKFDNEKNTEAIRKAVLRYQIKHPVVNDANMKIWDSYGCSSWPTIVVIDPEGYFVTGTSGEGPYEFLDRTIQKLIRIHTDKKTLNIQPIRFDLAKFRDKPDTPLYFPGKILADEKSKRLFIADSTHHRIVITDLDGNRIAIAGTGEPGRTDGPFDKAQFDDPQGMALKSETLYVADRRNHMLRALDLQAKTVKVIAGTGEQDRENRSIGGAALRTGMNSPWDLLLAPNGKSLYIAMAGNHQIWTYDFAEERLDPYAGDGAENIEDGSLFSAHFAQPSGLTTDGKTLFVADSEVSAIRAVGLGGKGGVSTLVGRGLFQFGDKDGVGDNVRLQHALGVLYHDGKLYVADTYNSKLKLLDPKTRQCETFLGGNAGGWLDGPMFNEPGGLSYANGKIYVADTNAHRIRVVDLKTKGVSTLALKGVPPVVMK